jgi:hypothetical protein
MQHRALLACAKAAGKGFARWRRKLCCGAAKRRRSLGRRTA